MESLFPVSLVHCPLLLVSLRCPASIQLVCITWLRMLLSGVPVFIAGESADVKATVAALKATVAEDMYHCDVALHSLSSKTPLYTSTSHLVSICCATAFDNRLPRYVAFTEGPMSSLMPVEIFSFLSA